MELAELLTIDNALLLIMVLFMLLWHKRTMSRDKMFNDTMVGMMAMLTECMSMKISESNKRVTEST